MKTLILLSSFLYIGLNFGQIKELKTASDKADKKINERNEKQSKVDYTQFVNPFIGTGGHGHTYPGVSAPFGMMQLSPDTRYDGWDGCSGYHYSDSIIYGFSHTHLSGTGVSDYGDLLIVPQNGKKAKTTPGYLDSQNGYGHRFSHKDEKASPGFYSVKFRDQGINVRLTSTERAGLHEYHFENKKGKKFILLDLDHRDQLLGKSLIINNKQSVSGFRISNAWATQQHFYFHLEFSVPFEKSAYITKNGQYKLLLTFPETTDLILIKVGMSGVDIEGARGNLSAEMPDFQFNKHHLETKQKWNSELSKITAETISDEQRTIFYTSLYHTCLQPNIWSDTDGRYRGRDKAIHQLSNNEDQYTVFSLWDTYRSAHPLYTLIQPDRNLDFIKTFLRQFDEGGDLPVWELAANETECMIGYHSVSVIADAFSKGIRDFDAEKALNAMIATSNFDELGKKQFRMNGFIGSGDEPESISKTLEYSYNDFCIAEMAKHMGKMSVYQEYYNRSLNFINLFDPSTSFMRARKGGLWHEPFDPAEVNFNYTEANSWQYSLYAPHAVDVLIDLLQGTDSLEGWLDRLFTTDMELSGRHQVDITGLIGQYAHGNEPSHHMAYLYNYSSAPHKTQHYVDQIMKEMYSDQPDGLSGNEDCGQMSAWYVLSALGLYQVTPGYPWYDFSRPIITEASINVGNGKALNIKSINNTGDNKYIERITWNGNDWTMNQISHSTIASGGELVFYMTNKMPEDKRSRSFSALNSDALLNFNFTPTPFFLNKNRVFEDSLKVELGSHMSMNGEDIRLEYRFSTDTSKVHYYQAPFTIDRSEKIEARRINHLVYGGMNSMPGVSISYSPWVAGEFIKKDNSVHLKLESEYSPQYAASGEITLIDGVQGSTEFRTGDYQGYYAKPIEGTIVFESERPISEVGVSCLQDMKSWIFYPKSISIEYSEDGTQFSKPVTFNDFPFYDSYVAPNTMDAFVDLGGKRSIKVIRFKIENFGKCPEWHLGSGNDTWLFVDEIIFR